MKTCPTCHQAVPDDALFCPMDGTSLAAVDADPLLGTVIGDRYVLLERVGQGGSGTIYRAEHIVLRQSIAIKLLHPEVSKDEAAVIRFRQEAATLAVLQSESFVKVSDFGVAEDGRIFFAMEYLEGETLAASLGRDGRFKEERALAILAQVGSALTEAHALGYVHRDIRPRNIFIAQRKDGQEVVKLLDFGLAKLVDSPKGALTTMGTSIGDPRYLSPEQARGDTVDQRSDIYSLAIIAYEMVTGHPPFVGAGTIDVLTKHLEAQAVPIRERVPEISVHYANAVSRALSKKAKDRYQKIEQLLLALANTASSTEPLAETTAGTKTPARARPIAASSPSTPGRAKDEPAAGPDLGQRIAKISAPTAKVGVKAAPPTVSAGKPALPSTPEPGQDIPAGATLMGVGLSPAPAGASNSTPSPAELMARAGDTTAAQGSQGAPHPPPSTPGLSGDEPLTDAPAAGPMALFVEPTAALKSTSKGAKDRSSPEFQLPAEPALSTAGYQEQVVSQTGNWFAEGMAAEQALASKTKSAPLPAIYSAIDDEEPVVRRFSPMLIIGGVVVLAAVVLFVLLMVVEKDKTTAVASSATKAGKTEIVRAKDPEPEVKSAFIGGGETTHLAQQDPKKEAPVATATPSKKGEKSKLVRDPKHADEPKAAKIAEPALAKNAEKKEEPQPKAKPSDKKAAPQAKPKSTAQARAEKKQIEKTRESRKAKRRSEPIKVFTPKEKKSNDPELADAEVKAGRNSLQKGDYSKAKASFTTALAHYPNHAGAHSGLGEVAFEMGQYPVAAKHLRAALRIAPRNSRNLVMLGNVYFKMGKTKEAVEAYRRALQLDPNNAAARAGLQAAVRRLAGN